MLKQSTSSILMVRPRFFNPNTETLASNNFQKIPVAAETIEPAAISEFDHVVKRLIKEGIYIIEHENAVENAPDAVFPNNWVSFHHDGTVIIYPMMAFNRRAEKRPEIIDKIGELFGISRVVDLTSYEKENMYLEGTGSMVFDHQHKIAYAVNSPRTSPKVFEEVCSLLGYQPVLFSAFINGTPIYHTNVLLNIGTTYAVVCLEAIPDVKERHDVRRMLAFTGHEVVAISISQMRMFAGNMIELSNDAGKHFTLLSSSAIRSLHLPEINIIGEHTELLSFDLPLIEQIGGGSIRCMIAEIFCNKKSS